MSKINRLSKYSPLLLRTAIGIVFLWFGFSQLANPSSWARMIPSYAPTFISQTSLIYLHGTFEIIFALLLLLGLFTRTSSLLLALNLLHITWIVGYGAVGARDLALTLATLSIFLHGADELSIDSLRKSRNTEHETHKLHSTA